MLYFTNRTHRVQIDIVFSEFANIICGVPQGNIGKIRNLLSYDACSTIIHALIFDYCNSILYNVPSNKMFGLQRIQNQYARIYIYIYITIDHS